MYFTLIFSDSNMKFAVKKHDAPDCCAFSRWKDPTLLLVYGSIDVHIVQGDLWLFDGFQGRGSCTLQKVSGAWTVHCLRIIDSKKSPTTGINSKLKQLNKKTGVFFKLQVQIIYFYKFASWPQTQARIWNASIRRNLEILA